MDVCSRDCGLTSPRACLFLAGLQAKDINFLVVNCSLFSPTPSLASMIVNQFKMGSDIITYNLAGMPPLLHIEFQNMHCLSFHPHLMLPSYPSLALKIIDSPHHEDYVAKLSVSEAAIEHRF